MSAESKRIRQYIVDFPALSNIRCIIKIAFLVRNFIVRRRRNKLIPNSHAAYHSFNAACATQQDNTTQVTLTAEPVQSPMRQRSEPKTNPLVSFYYHCERCRKDPCRACVLQHPGTLV